MLTAAASDDGFLRALGVRSTPGGGARAYVAFPTLGRLRWLLPVDPVLRRAGLQLYTPQRLRGRLLKRAIASGTLRGERVWIEGAILHELEVALGRWVGHVEETRLAFSLGTPGAFRKATAQVIARDGNVLGYAKIAIGPIAKAALHAEWHNLRRVSVTALRGHVPEPIHLGEWRGTSILLMSAGPSSPGPPDLGQSHFDFLHALHWATRDECEFRSSAAFVGLREAIARWEGVWPDPWPQRLARAVMRLESDLGAARVPLSLAHRDFAPWNTRSGRAGLFVFDWEMARDGMVPLHDAFHFEAIRAATRNAPVRSDGAYMARLLASVWPAGTTCLGALYLAYLVDTSVLYGEARIRAPDVGEERVWLWFGSRIDECLATRRLVS